MNKLIVDRLITARCWLDGIKQHVIVSSDSTFNRYRLINGLGDIKGTSEYPTKLSSCHIAGNLSVNYGVQLLNCNINTSKQGRVQIGRFVNGNNMNIAAGDAEVIIGSFCSIAGMSVVMTGHDYNRFTTYYVKKHVLGELDSKEVQYKRKTCRIGNDVWVGQNVLIVGGVNVGDGAVIGAGSVVTKDCMPYGIYAGNPARLLKYRFDKEIVDKLLKVQWWQNDIKLIKQLSDCAEYPVLDILKLIER